ncbi:PTS sugar transporter subunit IIA [Hyphomicrobium sp.]|jgi:PTS system nitrogen regulatory IIA component|uniref:PTS sugar transporter subunit IIA n=1 Tax=Hyphomicrobium sp. TaxID=82 RepID=UPI0035614ED7
MKITSFLAPGSVILDVRASDKIALLRDLAQRAANIVHVPSQTIVNELTRREELGSTGIGSGVAIPHARFAGIEKPFAMVARLKPPVNFDAIDGLPVDLVFLLLIPLSANTDHLNVLATISRRLRDRAAVDLLRSSKDEGSFYRALTGA